MKIKLTGLLLFILLLSACTDTNSNTSNIATPSPATGPLIGASPAVGVPVMTVNEVEVKLVDFSIQMPNTLPAKQTNFRVTNNGQTAHNFEIEGQGIEKKFDQNLQPGATESLMVDLKAGEYTIYCPVGNHAERGMKTMLTVTQ